VGAKLYDMIKKEDEYGGICVMSGKLGCRLCCICLYFAMFTIVERLCVLVVWIFCIIQVCIFLNMFCILLMVFTVDLRNVE
jgi:hypothetical protein